MELIACLTRQIQLAQADNEFCSASAELPFGLTLEILTVKPGASPHALIVLSTEDKPGITLRASAAIWRCITLRAPPVGFHSFTAAARQTADFTVEASALQIAQALHALERLFEILRGQSSEDDAAIETDLQQIHGSYARLMLADGQTCQVYYERSGKPDAPTLLMLHTAGADGRQFHPIMADPQLRQDWNMLTFDLPSHGRSMPLASALWQSYRLAKQDYINLCQAFIEQVALQPVVLLGCSMGAAMALKMAAVCPALVAGVIALEAPFRAAGRRTAMLAHPQVNQAAHNPSYVRGLMSPTSPLSGRRSAAWIYSQGGFQVYSGDLAFYSEEFDAETDLRGIDGSSKGIALLTGAYDYSATPADSQRVANLIPGARFTLMPDLGHFPMIENPARLLTYLKPELDYVRALLAPSANPASI